MTAQPLFRPQETVSLPTPHVLEAEQALLGCVLFENEAYHRIPALASEAFAEPLHGRMWAFISTRIDKNLLADPIVLIERFSDDPAMRELGGLGYLADLVDRAPPAANAYSYAETIREAAGRRELIRIGGDIIAAASTDHDTSSDDQVVEAEAALFALAKTGAGQTGGYVGFSDVVRGAVVQAEAAHSRDGALVGLSTGLIDLDQKLGGLHPSDLLILAGRPSMGKTALATNIGYHVARSGNPVGFVSAEMSAEQLGIRILADVAGVSGDRIRKGQTDISDIGRIRDAADEIERIPLYIDDTGGLSIAAVTARARRLKRQHGIKLLIIDYLQLLASQTRKGANRVEEVSEITRGLKALAKELGIPVLALSQLSRQVEQRDDKRPQLSDLRESGSIEQDADAVMFVYREAYYKGRAEPKEGTPEHLDWQSDMDQLRHVAEVIIGKQRHGPIGTVKLSFNEDTTKFGNLAREGLYAQADVRTPYARDE